MYIKHGEYSPSVIDMVIVLQASSVVDKRKYSCEHGALPVALIHLD
jgi:hypothetical protein